MLSVGTPQRYNSIYDSDPARYNVLRSCWLNRRRAAFVKDWMRYQPSGPVLEIGSGTGILLSKLSTELPDRGFVGLEPIDAYIKFAAERAARNTQYVKGVAEEAEACLGRKDFSVILSNDVLHHCYEPPRVARQVARVSSPHAQWLLIEPNCLNFYSLARQSLLPGERVFWPGPFLAAATDAGWELRRKGYLFAIPPFISNPPRWAQRLERKTERLPVFGGGVWMHLSKSSTHVR